MAMDIYLKQAFAKVFRVVGDIFFPGKLLAKRQIHQRKFSIREEVFSE